MGPHRISKLFSPESEELWGGREGRQKSAGEPSTPEGLIQRQIPSFCSLEPSLWEAHSRTSSILSIFVLVLQNKEWVFANHFWNLIALTQWSSAFHQNRLLFHLSYFTSEMIPFSNSVLDTTQRHCNPHWLLGNEEVKKKKAAQNRL